MGSFITVLVSLKDEVQMEDVVEEPVVDIDSCDKNNPLAVVEYIDDLYNFYMKAEVRWSLNILLDFGI